MTDFDTYAVGSDGWYEYDAPIEKADLAVFGWLNYEATDEIVPPSTGGQHWGDQEIFHYWHRRR